jgi:nitrite reductase/ring-hydroxylating ferredoxin subunit
MGKVLRRYWTPAFLLSDIPAPDCPPIGVTILDQDFVAFRDTSGTVGFLDELCCHRNASLTYGRVEEGGLRCLYHAWKFATDGTILEAPNCDSLGLLRQVKQGSYPVREAGGLGWVYLGPKEFEPPFPTFSWMSEDASYAVNEAVLDCNWVQLQEGSLDSSHLGLLHLDTIVGTHPGPRMVGSLSMPGEPWTEGGYGGSPGRGDGIPSDNNPPIYVEDTPFGFQYAAVRRTNDPTRKFVRVTALTMPYTAHIGGVGSGAVIVVPRTDTTSSFISTRLLSDDADRGGRSEERPDPSDTREFRFPQDGRKYVLPPQNRAAMDSRKSFAGFPGGNRPQDSAVQGANSRNQIFPRDTEHLVAADAAVLRFRSILFENAIRLEAGEPLLARGEGYDFAQISEYSGTVDIDANWEDLVPGNGSTGPLPTRQEHATV